MAKKKDKNEDFIQVYRDFYEDVIVNLAYENKQAHRLLHLIILHMGGDNALCVSYAALMEILQVSKSTVIRASKYLYDNGYVDIIKSGGTNVYVVNPKIAWTSYNSQKKFCKFNANVLVSLSENEGAQNTKYLEKPEAKNRFKTIDQQYIEQVRKNRLETEKLLQELDDGEVDWDDLEGVEQLPVEPTELS